MRPRQAVVLATFFLAAEVGGGGERAHAQAFVPPPGEASLSVSYTRFEGGDHLYDGDVSYSTRGYVCEGRSCFIGTEQSNTFTGSLDLGIRDRFAVSGVVSHVGARYVGNAPDNVNIDDGEWRSSFQDAYVQLRFQALRRYPLVVTPFLGYRFPLTGYPTDGHAARGRGRPRLDRRARRGPDLPGLAARVLPVPVLAGGRRSAPSISSGTTSTWTSATSCPGSCP